jgi:two-component system nitrate/nitrite response regulator NarL
MSGTPICIAGGSTGKRQALASELAAAGFETVAEFGDVSSCADAAGGFDEPELVLVISDAEEAGAESDVIAMRRAYPEARTVMLGGGASRSAFAAYIDAGLDGYVPSTLASAALAQSLRVILLGENIYVAGSRAAASRATRQDRRNAARKRTLQKASILVDGRSELLDGTVLDISDTGAKIRPGNMAKLPERFQLRCGYGRTYSCQVVRRSGFYLGVQFVGGDAGPESVAVR